MASKQSEYKRAERKKSGKTKYQQRADSPAKSKSEQEWKRTNKKKQRIKRVRIFPVWLRVIVISILAVAALMAGLMIGYGVIGDGEPLDALKVETWEHIIDIVVREE